MKIYFQCVGQTWYLANDMQMFIITPLILYPLWKLNKVGLAWSGILVFGSILIPTILTVTEDWPGQMMIP